MRQFESADGALDFAIQNEQDAFDFYMGLAGRMRSPAMKKVFENFAKEERGHKAKLEAVKAGKKLRAADQTIRDLKVGDYLVEGDAPDVIDSYQDALILAMKQEKAAFKLYSDLAATTEDAELTTLFGALAQEEARHKLRFEVEYDEFVLGEN